ncbi:MAG: DNA polymerase, partial [Burkholderiales bacterium]
MKRPAPVAVDVETFGIEGRPDYPPVPVGVAVQWPGRRPRYYAFGHATGSNATWTEARQAVKAAYAHPDGVVMQNANFDLDVIETHLELPPPSWHRVHDTLFLLYLDDPRAPSLGLKESAARILQQPPAERDEVLEWLISHQPVPGIKISDKPRSKHYAMKYLPFAPGGLVGRYANGDVVRTTALFKVLWVRIRAAGMLEAYDRERRLLPILLAAERRGVAVATQRLAHDVTVYESALARVDIWLRAHLGLTATDNLDSSPQLGAALLAAKVVDPAQLALTPTGNISTARASLNAAVSDPVLKAVLTYRARLKTSLGTFMLPWLATAQRTHGLIYTRWHQVRAEDGGGTRTGRLSSSPNFQNVPRTPEPVFRTRGAAHLPPSPVRGLRSLPNVRSYVI